MTETLPPESSRISKFIFGRRKTPAIISDGVMFISGALVALLFFCSFPIFTTPNYSSRIIPLFSFPSKNHNAQTRPDPTTFYDDPDLSYWVEHPVRNWDEKRRQWLAANPAFSGHDDRLIMVTGSRPGPCPNPTGDHLLLRLFKNKVDYCRIHGYGIFYNNVLLHPKMSAFWAKYAAIRAAMMAHPESEWVWWVDSDAAITDMDFNLPLKKYGNHNLIVNGWADVVYEKKSWTGLNAGVFLIRNCQWSMDLMDRWVKFGPQSPDYEKSGQLQKSMFKDKMYPESDDQTALEYMLVEEGEKWREKVYLESEYYFQGYWVEIVGKLENVSRRYGEIERLDRRLRRRHAEGDGEEQRKEWEEYLRGVDTGGYAVGSWKRPFITHFTGCEPCTGDHNEIYSGEACWDGLERALNFADNQVLNNFGYFHPDLRNSSWVQLLPL